MTQWLPALCGGAASGLLLPGIYFWLTGRFGEFWLWTVEFPLVHYQSSTKWVHKMYTKLLWFPIIVLMSVIVALSVPRVRVKVFRSRPETLALSMGVVSLLVLLKKQSPHYYFPGAAFMAIFIASVASSWLVVGGKDRRRVRIVLGCSLMVASMVVLSAVLYQPKAFQRLAEIRSFQDEAEVGAWLREQVQPNERVLFLSKSSSKLYWRSHR